MAPCIDLFASYRHHQLQRYYSPYQDEPEALGQNAFAYLCDPGICLYACIDMEGIDYDRYGRFDGVVSNATLE